MPNSNRISIDDLSKAISKTLLEYKEDIDNDVEDTANEVTEQAKDELARISPKTNHIVSYTHGSKSKRTIIRPGEYAANWYIKKNKNSNNQYSNVIYNKKHYRLTHLLEFRHVNRNGTGYTTEKPHIRPTEQKYKEIYLQKLEAKIRRN